MRLPGVVPRRPARGAEAEDEEGDHHSRPHQELGGHGRSGYAPARRGRTVGRMSDAVTIERQGPFVRVTLDHPEKRNTLSLEVLRSLTAAFTAVGETDALGVVLAANGPVFSAGHDFAEMAGTDLEQARQLFATCTRMMDTIQSIPQPVVARVHGLATAAGCQLVASCDLAVAAESAGFAIPGGKGGLFCHTPVVAVVRAIGRKRALEMAFTGDVDQRRDRRRLGPHQQGRARRPARRRRRRPARAVLPRAARSARASASTRSTRRSTSTPTRPTRSPSR